MTQVPDRSEAPWHAVAVALPVRALSAAPS